MVRGATSVGVAYLVAGRRDFGPEQSLADRFEGIGVLGEERRSGLGRLVASVGDFNGDGSDDLLVGAPNLEALSGKGRAYLVYGTGPERAPFRVVSVEPLSGPVRGGTEVTIRGSGFEEPLEVLFDGRAARAVTALSASELRVLTPAGDAPGFTDIAVRVGEDTRVFGKRFEYVSDLPEIDLAQPAGRGIRVKGEPGFAIGHSLAFADVTADGVDDLLIGSEGPGGWVVSVLRGGPGLPDTIGGLEASARVSLLVRRDQRAVPGVRVADAGDIDGDGVADIGITASDGSTYLFFGRADLGGEADIDAEVTAGRAVRIEHELTFSDYTELTIVGLGDVTGDDVDDFAIGMAGSVSLVRGRIVFVAGRRDWPGVFSLSAAGAYFSRIDGTDSGFADELVALGDVDGDGLVDLLANSSPEPTRARSFLIHGSDDRAAAIGVDALVAAGGGVVFDRVDRAATVTSFVHVAAAGDVNGDGHADMLFGDETGGVENRGMTFLVLGSPDLVGHTDLPGAPGVEDGILRVLGAADGVQSGRGIGPAGDFDGDGFDDFLVGSQSPRLFPPGSMALILGGSKLPGSIDLGRIGPHGVTIPGIEAITRLEVSAPAPGDLGGDGSPDFAFSERGSPGFPAPDGAPSSGSVHVVFGLPSSVPFIRGDVTFNEILDVTDPVFLLGFLFLGTESPPCEDAADADENGELGLTDAVYILGHLFLGGSPPPAPFPGAGTDPGEDELDCRGS